MFFVLPLFLCVCVCRSLYLSSVEQIKIYIYIVAPSTMQMQDETGQTLRNDTIIGPLSEGQRFVSYCEARGARPKPNVGWYLHGKRLPGEFYKYILFELTAERKKKSLGKLHL